MQGSINFAEKMIYNTHKRNTPVVTLIRNYVNKKSGKVSESRDEIKTRFDYLDWTDQKKFLMEFLDGCMSDRKWAYMKLTSYWDKSFEPKVKERWEHLHEPECSRCIIRFFPISYVMENMHYFTSPIDNYNLCLRFAEDPEYVIDRTKLSAIDYLSVIYYSDRSLSEEEATDILFEIIHDLCENGFEVEDFDLSNYTGDLIRPTNFQVINIGRVYLYKMGLYQAVACFKRWADKVQMTMYNSEETKVINRFTDEVAKMEWALKICRKYCYLALDDKYKKTTDTSINKLLASDDWEMLLNPVEVPSKIKSPTQTSDPNYLIELSQSNPAIRALVGSFELQMDDDAVPF